MDLPAGLLDKYTTAKPHAPRSDWEATLDSFYERINTPAVVRKYGEMSRSRIGKGLKGKSSFAIQNLFKDCARARSFGALFRHLTKV